jgi:uncharacterized membrane protein
VHPLVFTAVLSAWSAAYAGHSWIRTTVAFIHLASLIAGGGSAIASSRAVLSRTGPTDSAGRSELVTLAATHRFALMSLALIVTTGMLWFASDVDKYTASTFFWIKMALAGMLLVNGAFVQATGARALRQLTPAAWADVRLAARFSVALWLLTTLAGVAL